jgi:hypothetical protein
MRRGRGKSSSSCVTGDNSLGQGRVERGIVAGQKGGEQLQCLRESWVARQEFLGGCAGPIHAAGQQVRSHVSTQC